MKWVVILALVILCSLPWGYRFIWGEEEVPKTPPVALCEAGTVNQDGSITLKEDKAGNYEYTILTTSQGIKIYTTCE